MSTTNTSIYMEHPLVRAREAGEIRQPIREHLVSEFTFCQAEADASLSTANARAGCVPRSNTRTP